MLPELILLAATGVVGIVLVIYARRSRRRSAESLAKLRADTLRWMTQYEPEIIRPQRTDPTPHSFYDQDEV